MSFLSWDGLERIEKIDLEPSVIAVAVQAYSPVEFYKRRKISLFSNAVTLQSLYPDDCSSIYS